MPGEDAEGTGKTMSVDGGAAREPEKDFDVEAITCVDHYRGFAEFRSEIELFGKDCTVVHPTSHESRVDSGRRCFGGYLRRDSRELIGGIVGTPTLFDRLPKRFKVIHGPYQPVVAKSAVRISFLE